MEVLLRPVDLPAEFIGIGHTKRPHRLASKIYRLRGKPLKTCVVESAIGIGSEDLVRFWALQCNYYPSVGLVYDLNNCICAVCVEMIKQPLFGERGACQVEAVFVGARDGHFDFYASTTIQCVSYNNTANLARIPIGDEIVE